MNPPQKSPKQKCRRTLNPPCSKEGPCRIVGRRYLATRGNLSPPRLRGGLGWGEARDGSARLAHPAALDAGGNMQALAVLRDGPAGNIVPLFQQQRFQFFI